MANNFESQERTLFPDEDRKQMLKCFLQRTNEKLCSPKDEEGRLAVVLVLSARLKFYQQANK